MFYAPKTVASMVDALTPDEHEGFKSCFSDFHKDAIGCRPRTVEVSECLVEAAVQHARLQEWVNEGERIAELEAECARFRFSQRMEYLLARGEVATKLDAFKMAIQICCVRPYPNDDLPTWESCLEEAEHYGWDYLAYNCQLPAKDGVRLKEMYDELMG